MSTKPDPAGEFVEQAYRLNDEHSVKRFYRTWAQDYDDKMLEQLGYQSPYLLARKLHAHLDNPQAHILDLGCGTGLGAVYLHQLGYRNLAGIDLSSEMVALARSRQLYRSLHVGNLNQPLAFADQQFDAAVCAGTFTHGHVGPQPLAEILRILKPAGILACTVHADLWRTAGFEAEFARLEQANRVEKLTLELDRYYRDGAPEGWFCVYRKPT